MIKSDIFHENFGAKSFLLIGTALVKVINILIVALYFSNQKQADPCGILAVSAWIALGTN